ncbi:MAG: hypothetical protein WAK22_00685, partial [Candidatus Sulfotelmatobacter sp.]
MLSDAHSIFAVGATSKPAFFEGLPHGGGDIPTHPKFPSTVFLLRAAGEAAGLCGFEASLTLTVAVGGLRWTAEFYSFARVIKKRFGSNQISARNIPA